MLNELLRSPGEQQTEITRRHFRDIVFYRLDPDLRKMDPPLERPIDLDDFGSGHLLRHYGEQFAAQVDWGAILAGTDTTYRITDETTQWPQYKQPGQKSSR